MGAQQSSQKGSSETAAIPKKTDYYELLGLDRQATDDEIKKAYRRKALELHPDRNYGDVENATQKFAEVQAAYEVLSDPQERAWYDSHRDAILRGDDPAETGATPEFHNVRITTADEIFTLIGRFNKNVSMDDSPNSFFTVLRDTFERIAGAEDAAVDWAGVAPVEYPSFGKSTDDDSVAKAFYVSWTNFSTKLSFAWKDKWRLSDAPDRRVRRLMEKENKKFREDAAREFNDAVRSLVAFVRKRDPRYVANTQSEAERQNFLRDSAAAQAARSRAANQEKMNDPFAVPEWARSRDDQLYEGEFSEADEESEVEHIECVVCNKTFKSEKQYEAHEKSKKHAKAVQQLQRQMKKENVNFHLGLKTPTSNPQISVGDDDLDDDFDTPENNASTIEDGSIPVEVAKLETELGKSKAITIYSEDDSEDDEYASRDAIEARLLSGKSDPLQGDEYIMKDITRETEEMSLQNSEPTTKVGKAKAKREKKAARQAALEPQDDAICAACNTPFESRTKLFKHLKQTGHAAPKITTSKTTKKRR
ncbi:DnaJ-domain-containing protein [Daldinia sp. FL1419]|nr:DnaJ-domain-containing protein [Daldinia sp. FL1419]